MNPDSASCEKSMASLATNDTNSIEMLASRDPPAYETLAQELSAAAAQLIEAAYRARGGDGEASRAHLAHAIALLRGIPSVGPRRTHLSSSVKSQIVRGGLPAWKMQKVSAYVEANLSRRIQVKDLAQLLALSSGHFCRAFKRQTGASPREYVIRRRIEVAQAMMLTTSEPLHSISISCGMCDQQHFTHSFRRIVGETPSRWRGARRGLLKAD